MNTDMRDAFFNGVYKAVEKDKNVIVLTADHGAFGLSLIERDFPKQFLNVGIAEQNMISVASGLARCGKIVYAYSINNFISLRSLEQVNLDMCAMNLHVNLIGVGAGFTYSTDGPTHQGMQDMQAMSVLPNLSVYNVTDSINSTKLAEMSYDAPGPKYFRIEKGMLPVVYDDNADFYLGASVVSKSNKTYIISTGYMTKTAIEVSKRLNDVGVIDLYRVKPINDDYLLSTLSGVENIITLEEGTSSGGIGEKIAAMLLKNKNYCNYLPISVDDKHCYSYGTRNMLHKEYDLDSESVYKKIDNFLKNQ